MSKTRTLTGITTTGTPHLGNYAGAIKPAIAASQQADSESFFFLADYHALVKCFEPQRLRESTLAIAARSEERFSRSFLPITTHW